MAGVDFTLALIDKVTAPAKRITSSLGAVESKAKALNGVDPMAGVKGLSPAGGGSAGGPAGALAGMSFAPVVAGLTAITAAAAAAATAVAAIGAAAAVAFSKATLDAAIFRETSIKSLDVAFGAGQGAGRFEQAKKLALEYGESLDTVVGALREFRQAGFSDKTSLDLFKGLQDLRVASPTTQIDGIILAIKQIQGTGYLQGDELGQLRDAGLDQGKIFDALVKKTGKTVAELMKMKEAGKLTADLVIPAITEAMQAMAGGKALGELAKDATRNTLGGALRGLGNLPALLFDSIAKNVDTKSLTGLVTGLTDFLTGPDVAAALASAGTVFGAFVEAGASVLSSIGGALGGLFGDLAPTGQTFAESLIAGAGAIKDAAPAIGELVSAVGGPLVDAFRSVSESFAGMSPEAKLAGFQALSQGAQILAFTLAAGAEIIGNWISGIGAIAAAFLEVEAVLRGIMSMIEQMVAAAANFGGSMGNIGAETMGSGFGAVQAGVGNLAGGAQGTTVSSNQSVTVSAAGFGADELAARVASEVQNALRSLVPQVV